ncbi:TetR/AcrR family transcriptional regulator [Lysinibacter cavernae]|uniref:AcrR family transcriptional regulator n=1 Tax=Lysinibacter cavernae TaxID=1640652 RepID=A0A7X5QYF7_9MICO|nr:TetR/AcrR family transcriptional regulator [Lysinibacter cavernae]NIH52241.1 AcrR family transcriptional regulator [Lysinibacter cavernae]
MSRYSEVSEKGIHSMGTREQNRIQTVLAMQRATLDLVERQGLAATTIGQIAANVGVSERTFFRYFSSKEHAILPGHHDLTDALVSSDIVPGERSDMLKNLLQISRTFFANEVDRQEFRRISRLLVNEPELMGAVTRQERALVSELSPVLERKANLSFMQALLLAETVVVAWRVAWLSYAHDEVNGGDADPLALFDQTMIELGADADSADAGVVAAGSADAGVASSGR